MPRPIKIVNTKAMDSAAAILRDLKVKKASFWNRMRETRALKLFQAAAKRVPAYKDFLKRRKINPEKIKTWQDFQSVPSTSKKNYLYEYPLEKVSWDGTLAKPLVFTSTSGSTGTPFYFARGEKLDYEHSLLSETFLKISSQRASPGPSLVIIGFGMGVWIGGLISYKSFEIASRRGQYPVSIITPGINKIEIFQALRRLSPHFKETILCGYPPFVKDVVDEALAQGIDLARLHMRIFCAAEVFSETFRDYLCTRAGVVDAYRDTTNIYGSADMGAMAWETPASILVRRAAMKGTALFHDLFGAHNKIPTLAQYNPAAIAFESEGGEILLTSDSAVPLIRYAIGDRGGVMRFPEMKAKLAKHTVDFAKEVRRAGIDDVVYQFPFVYVYERNDFAVSLYGVKLYPEYVREAFLWAPLARYVTGKCNLMVKFDRRENQFFEINIEVRAKMRVPGALTSRTAEIMVSELAKRSSEYRELHKHLKARVEPRIHFWPYEDPLHFKPGAKQRWVK